MRAFPIIALVGASVSQVVVRFHKKTSIMNTLLSPAAFAFLAGAIALTSISTLLGGILLIAR
jgi:hypothetical protein